MIPNNDYGEYIGRELVEITRRMFPLSRKREDTFLAGNSMGGYGAIRNGIKYADTFSRIVGFSCALHMFEMSAEKIIEEYNGALKIYGDLGEAAETNMNPEVALKEAIENEKELPKIYMCCGLEDSLLESNRIYKTIFEENGVNFTYEELEGGHTWEFWDMQLPKVLDWLEL